MFTWIKRIIIPLVHAKTKMACENHDTNLQSCTMIVQYASRKYRSILIIQMPYILDEQLVSLRAKSKKKNDRLTGLAENHNNKEKTIINLIQ